MFPPWAPFFFALATIRSCVSGEREHGDDDQSGDQPAALDGSFNIERPGEAVKG